MYIVGVSLLFKNVNHSEFQTHLRPLFSHERLWISPFLLSQTSQDNNFHTLFSPHWFQFTIWLTPGFYKDAILAKAMDNFHVHKSNDIFHFCLDPCLIWLSWSPPASWDTLLSLGFHDFFPCPPPTTVDTAQSIKQASPLYIIWRLVFLIILSVYYHSTFLKHEESIPTHGLSNNDS